MDGSLVQYKMTTDVDISPGALGRNTVNAGRLTDNPVLWFHGCTHSSSLPSFAVQFGFARTGKAAPLNILGYNSTSSATFVTNLRNTNAAGVQFGVFPKSPLLWLAGNSSLNETTTFENGLSLLVNQNLLSSRLEDVENPNGYNMYSPTGQNFPEGPPFVPLGDANGLPSTLKWTSQNTNITGNNNQILILYDAANTVTYSKSTVLQLPQGQ